MISSPNLVTAAEQALAAAEAELPAAEQARDQAAAAARRALLAERDTTYLASVGFYRHGGAEVAAAKARVQTTDAALRAAGQRVAAAHGALEDARRAVPRAADEARLQVLLETLPATHPAVQRYRAAEQALMEARASRGAWLIANADRQFRLCRGALLYAAPEPST